MEIFRANKNYKSYVKNIESLKHNTFFIAMGGEKNLVGTCEFKITSMDKCEISYLNIIKDFNIVELINGLIDEFIYWNPFIKEIYYSNTYSKLLDDNLEKIKFNKVNIEMV